MKHNLCIVIAILLLISGSYVSSQENPYPLRFDPTFYLLGMLDADHRLHPLSNRPDYLDSFRQEYLADLFQFYLRELMRTSVEEAEFNVVFKHDGSITFYSDELSDYFNSFFDISEKDYEQLHTHIFMPCTLSVHHFDDDNKIVSYLAGVYSRYNMSYGYSIRWNSPKARLVVELLERFQCKDITVEYPDTTGVSCGQPPMKIKFDCNEDIWNMIQNYDLDYSR